MEIDKFLEIEKKYSLYTQKIDDINYWIYSRVQIWNFQICAQKLGLQNTHSIKKRNSIEWIKIVTSLIRHSICRGKIISQVDVLFLAHGRRIRIDGTYKCIYTEPLAEYFSNSMTLDIPYECMHLEPKLNLNRYYLDYIFVTGKLYYIMHKLFKTKHYRTTLSQIQKQMEKPLQELINSYSVPIKLKTLYHILHEKLLIVECERKLYDKLLRKIAPKLIIEVVYYGRSHCMILNELAKKYGIPTIELQHGTMHKDHAAYQLNWDGNIPQLPDNIFLFSDFWKKQIRVPIADENLIVTGFPYFEQNRNKYLTNRATSDKKKILFISQGPIGDKLSKFAVEVANLLIPKGYQIAYRLHPAEINSWEMNYGHLKNVGIEVLTGENQSLYECFAESDIQVGVYSTAIYEGLGFGLRTFIYNIGYAETMFELVDKGYAQIVNNSNEFIELLKEDNCKKENSFWSDNALYNMKNAVESILKKENDGK